MSEVEQRRGQLPSDSARKTPDTAAKVRRNAWLLAGVAALVYLGYIAWMYVRAGGG